MLFDAFISHAWEDKDSFVRQLAERLHAQRIEVWYDEFSLKAGDSLRRSIDFGLSKSRFGIVVLSEYFFKKDWPNWELDGLVQRQNSSDYNLIIPIWHNIDKKDLLKYSPSLADKVAIKTSRGIDYVTKQIDSIINPKGSTLIIARDFLLNHGYEPPVISDDWWLDVIEYCGNQFPQSDYLRYSIPWKSYSPKDRGIYIGMSALQMLWQEEAEANRITQLSHPNDVLSFIENQPGLKTACAKDPKRTAFYFPQLTIKTFGGFLETDFDNLLKAEVRYQSKHECELEFALRHPSFGHFDCVELADSYFTGATDGIGASTSQYDLIDCLVWLLSDKSLWMPKAIRKALLKGITDWGVWEWDSRRNSISNFESNAASGALSEVLYKTRDKKSIKLTLKIRQDIKTRIEHSKSILNLPEAVEALVKTFLDNHIIESWIKSKYELEKLREKQSRINARKTKSVA